MCAESTHLSEERERSESSGVVDELMQLMESESWNESGREAMSVGGDG